MPLFTLDTRKVERLLNLRDKARKQAATHALTLFVMAGFFVITWVFMALELLWEVRHGK